MARPFIEFLQSQALAWQTDAARTGRRGLECKLLSEDDATGAMTMLVRYPPGFSAAPLEWCTADEEILLLRGSLALNGRTFAQHHYAYWPAGYTRHGLQAGPEGATLIACFSARPRYRIDAGDAPAFDAAALTEQVDAFALRWDQTNMDPNISHLNAFRKNLRLGPGNSGRSYLLAGLPQGFPKSASEPLERHPHFEEMFMIAGDMPCSLGVMRAGAYFWRPPMIWHGADCTTNGFLVFARTPGTNRTISEWSTEGHLVTFTPEHRPQLPPELAAAGVPAEDPVQY
jgi:hypothetical protein